MIHREGFCTLKERSLINQIHIFLGRSLLRKASEQGSQHTSDRASRKRTNAALLRALRRRLLIEAFSDETNKRARKQVNKKSSKQKSSKPHTNQCSSRDPAPELQRPGPGLGVDTPCLTEKAPCKTSQNQTREQGSK